MSPRPSACLTSDRLGTGPVAAGGPVKASATSSAKGPTPVASVTFAATATARPRPGKVRSVTVPSAGLPRWLTTRTGAPPSRASRPSSRGVGRRRARGGASGAGGRRSFRPQKPASASPSECTRSVGVERKAPPPASRIVGRTSGPVRDVTRSAVSATMGASCRAARTPRGHDALERLPARPAPRR